MLKSLTIVLGGLLAAALMVGAIYAWIDLADWALAGQRPDVLRWAARSLAVAAAAGAQVIVITFVLGRVYRMRPFHETVRLAAALICCTAAVSAAALGLASQG
ncbi:MAG: hypothetical protein ACTHM6_12540 [Tepidisphaeraceae bacterium]